MLQFVERYAIIKASNKKQVITMKRFFALLLALSTLASLAGCTGTPQTDGTTQPPATNGTVTPPQAAANLQISEVMPDNKFLTLGHENDWVELQNLEDTAVSLDGYFLTDDAGKPTQLPLEGLSIPAGGYLVIVLDEAAPFRLSAEGETVYLYFQGQALSQVTYGLSENGESYDAQGVCPLTTPGYANTQEGYGEYLQGLQLPELYISEVMSSNSKYLPVNGECYDLVEVKNNSSSAINLADYTLTDKRSEPGRYIFPNVTLQPGEYFVVYCSGNTNLGSDHASFKISASGENVYLAKNGKIVDALVIPGNVQKNQSFGRDGNAPAYFAAPTPGKDNAAGYEVALSAPQADVASGIYDEAVTVSLSASGTIYYTLDGSRPTTESKIYTDPIVIDGITTIRTFCTEEERSSELVSYTYLVGVQHQLPVVSIAIPQSSLTGSRGVLNHIDRDYEYEAVVTLIEDGEEKFSVPFGFRLHGNDSRKGAKQNFQLRFRSEYGASKLQYPLFDDRPFTEYDSLLLKGGSEKWYADMLCDEVATAVPHGTTSLYTQAMKPVALYLGGKFWGVYFFRERFSDDYVASHFGVTPESVDILESSAAWPETDREKEFIALRNYVSSHDMSEDAHFNYLMERIDAQSLIDWYICRSYVGDQDTANVRRFRTVEGDGKWRWMYFDLDWAFYFRPNERPIALIMQSSGGDKILMNGLLEHPAGRDMFLKRYAELMGTILNEEYFVNTVDRIVAMIDADMPQDRQRWGQSYAGWEEAVEEIRAYFKDGARDAIVLKDIKRYFNLSDEQMAYYFGDVMK